ncbi:MAG: adenylyl-sulfate kinase [Bacteroidota bacterium]
MADFNENIIPQSHSIQRQDRIEKYQHHALVVWFVGLSGSGKSTLANALENNLFNKGYKTYILDGDNIRSGLNKDLDFSDLGRKENIRRISEVAKLFADSGTIVLTAFISPFKADRASAKKLIGKEDFVEVHVDCPLEVCERRDVKGLYKKAREGKIRHFTGINSPFEIPETPDIKIDTASNSLDACLKQLIEEIEPRIKP